MSKYTPYTGLIVSIALLLGLAGFAPAAEKAPKTMLVSSEPTGGGLDESIQNEVNAAIDRGLDWLAAQQKADGSWSNSDFPAISAFALQAFAGADHPKKKEVITKAKRYILSCVQPDGGIYKIIKGRKGGGLSNYNTAISMTALHRTGDPDVTRVVLNARKYIAASQHLGGDIYDGGFGYDKDSNRAYTDGLNTMYAVIAMVETASVEDRRPKTEKRVDIDWSRTVEFMSRLQNKPEDGEDQAGGFPYKPGESKAGSFTNDAGKVILRSYGSMTYVGLLTLVYANVSHDDVRVRSAFDWARNHWSLEENPGMGAQGLYFFYNIIGKSLNAYGAEVFKIQDKKDIAWRKALANKVLSLQKIDPKTGHGYWTNDQGRFWENDPILVTGYSLLSLETL